jgi:hypothetical protein
MSAGVMLALLFTSHEVARRDGKADDRYVAARP